MQRYASECYFVGGGPTVCGEVEECFLWPGFFEFLVYLLSILM